MAANWSIPPPVSSSDVSKPKFNRKLLVAVLVIAVVIVGLLATWWFVQWDFGYTRIKVVEGHFAFHEFDGTEYFFYLRSSAYTSRIRVSAGSEFGGTYLTNDTQGTRHEVLGLEILVFEMHEDYAVIKVKPL